jgi:tetratricopeptide (TPR) repeat protein
MAAAVTLTGCSKKLGQLKSDYFTTNPTPLEVVGENVPATVSAQIPAKYFVKNAVLTVTPVLEGANGATATAASSTYQGENVRANNPTISYDQGGNMTIPATFPYTADMATSTLKLNFTVQQGKKTYTLPAVTVGNGVIATATLADASTVTPAVAPDAFQRIIADKYNADILFLINQANIRDNQLRTAEMTGLNQQLKDANADAKREIQEVNISSYASPDGALDFNTKLAQSRETTTKTYMENQLKGMTFGELTADFTPEDWEGFRRLVSESNIQDKDLILSVLSMYKDPEEREREIHNLSHVFDQLAEEILPQLRYSRITATINTIGKSDEEIAAAYAADPSQLTVEEILYYGAQVSDPDKKAEVYAKAAQLYPTDYRTYNNLGMAQYAQGNYADAASSLKQAARLQPSAGEPQMNLGLVSMVSGDYDDAQSRFGNAAGVPEVSEALGVYYLKTGDNTAAARALEGVNSNNAALAQILTKDYSSAKRTLAAINDPDATTYYLTAVLGARTNNENMITNNLRQAIKLDPSLATRAASDLEFSRYNLSAIL